MRVIQQWEYKLNRGPHGENRKARRASREVVGDHGDELVVMGIIVLALALATFAAVMS